MSAKRSFSYVAVVAITVLSTIFATQYLSCKGAEGKDFGSKKQSPLSNSDKVAKAWDVQKSFRSIFDIYKDRVVSIYTKKTVRSRMHPFFRDPFFREWFGTPRRGMQPRTRKRTGLGSGFIISEDGYICTNHHVVNGVDSVTVKVGEKSYKAEIIGSDKATDLALLKIKGKVKLKAAYLGDSDKVRVGDWAIAIGNPFGLNNTFTVGVVSAVGRKDLAMAGRIHSHIQTDASINPGNSGGPLINIKGEVVGINRMIYSKSGGNMGIGFAIPINKAKHVLQQLKKFGKIKRGFIGVQIVNLTAEYAKERGLKNPHGALIGAVVPGGPAAKAGAREGDIILRVGKTKIKKFNDLIEAVEKTPIGKTVKIRVLRGTRTISLFITVGERPKE
jgi:serine protease Do